MSENLEYIEIESSSGDELTESINRIQNERQQSEETQSFSLRSSLNIDKQIDQYDFNDIVGSKIFEHIQNLDKIQTIQEVQIQ